MVLRLEANTRNFERQMARAQRESNRRLYAIEKRAQTFGKRIQASMDVTIFARTAAAAGSSVLGVAGNFEQSMNRVKALTSATAGQFGALRTEAMKLGSETAFSAGQAADAMGFLAMAGFDTEKILGSMADTLNLAAAAQLDLADAADIVSNVLTGFNRPVEDLAEVNDVLVATFTNANTNLQQLGQAFKFVGPIASSAGVDFNETAAALGLLGNAGLQAEMAGTGLRGAILRILNPTSQAKRVMEEYGLQLTDTSGRLKPLVEVLKEFEPYVEDTTLFGELFGQRAGPAMINLVRAGADNLQAFTEKLENSGGIAKRIADTQMMGLNGALRELNSAWEDLLIRAADEGGLAAAEGAVDRLTGALRFLSRNIEGIYPWIERLAVIIGARLAPAAALMAGRGVISLGAALIGLSGAAAGATTATSAFTAALSRLTGPASLLLAIVGFRWIEFNRGVREARERIGALKQPIGDVEGGISGLEQAAIAYKDAIGETASAQTSATDSIIADSKREFEAKKQLLALEIDRKEQALSARQVEISNLRLQRQRAGQVATAGQVGITASGPDQAISRLRQSEDVRRGAIERFDATEAGQNLRELTARQELERQSLERARIVLETDFREIAAQARAALTPPEDADAPAGRSNALKEILDLGVDRITQARQEQAEIGKTAGEVAALRYETEALQKAREAGLLSGEQEEEVRQAIADTAAHLKDLVDETEAAAKAFDEANSAASSAGGSVRDAAEAAQTALGEERAAIARTIEDEQAKQAALGEGEAAYKRVLLAIRARDEAERIASAAAQAGIAVNIQAIEAEILAREAAREATGELIQEMTRLAELRERIADLEARAGLDAGGGDALTQIAGAASLAQLEAAVGAQEEAERAAERQRQIEEVRLNLRKEIAEAEGEELALLERQVALEEAQLRRGFEREDQARRIAEAVEARREALQSELRVVEQLAEAEQRRDRAEARIPGPAAFGGVDSLADLEALVEAREAAIRQIERSEAIEDAAAALGDYATADDIARAKEIAGAIHDAGAAAKEAEAAFQRADRALRALFEARGGAETAEFEASLIGLTDEDAIIRRRARRAGDARMAELGLSDGDVAAGRSGASIRSEFEAQERRRLTAERSAEQRRAAVELIEGQRTAEERLAVETERLSELETALAQVIFARADGAIAINDAQAQATARISEAVKKLQPEYQRLAEMSRQFGQAASGALEDIVFGAKDAGDAVRGLALELAKIVFRQQIGDPLAEAIGGAGTGLFGNLLGGLFGGGAAVQAAGGGLITGPGGPRSDAIPAMLSNGEFVVNAAATARHRGLLEAINGGGGAATRLAAGGFVGGGRAGGGASRTVHVHQTVTVTGLGIDDVERRLAPRFDQLRRQTVADVDAAFWDDSRYLGAR